MPHSVLRLYEDARPHVGKIARLQKGLVWVVDGQELVEEGYGFGCPIVQVDGAIYNSRRAEIERTNLDDRVRLIKCFYMDTLDTPIRLLRRKYRSVVPIGFVLVSYDIYPTGVIDIDVDLSGITAPWDRAYVMTEQGANTFTTWVRDDGTTRGASELGIWQEADTERSCLRSSDRALQFCVEPSGGTMVYVGRERYLQYNWRGVFYLSWAGIDLSVSPSHDRLAYRVTLVAN